MNYPTCIFFTISTSQFRRLRELAHDFCPGLVGCFLVLRGTTVSLSTNMYCVANIVVFFRGTVTLPRFCYNCSILYTGVHDSLREISRYRWYQNGVPGLFCYTDVVASVARTS